MKILYSASIRLPTEKAHGIQIMKMCEAFAQSGTGVTLAVPNFIFSYNTENPFDYYAVKPVFSIKRFFSIRLIVLGQIGYFLETFVFFLSLIFSKSFWSSDYFFSRDEFLVFFAILLGRKTVWETHTGSYNFFARFVLKRTQKIISISQGLKDFYVQKRVPAEKILVAHDGVDLDYFLLPISKSESRKLLGLPDDKKIVMYVGRLDGWKGSDVLLRSSNNFDSNTMTVVIGGESAQVYKLSAQYPKVTFLGHKPYKDLPVYQKSADILVIPNSANSDISKFYTSPLKLFAHMASGVPIVASRLPSICEVLNNENSILVNPDDSESLFDGVSSILEKKINADILARHALQDVKEYSWKLRAEKIIKFLN